MEGTCRNEKNLRYDSSTRRFARPKILKPATYVSRAFSFPAPLSRGSHAVPDAPKQAARPRVHGLAQAVGRPAADAADIGRRAGTGFR